MKKLLLIALIAVSFTVNAQMRIPAPYEPSGNYAPLNESPEIYVPIATLLATFSTNEYLMHAPEYTQMTGSEQRKMTSTVYFTGAIITVGGHYLIKYIKENKHKIKRMFK